MLFVLRRNSIGADLYVICPSTLIFRYYYSIEELGGRVAEAGAGQNPDPNPDPKPAPPSLPAPYVALRFWWP